MPALYLVQMNPEGRALYLKLPHPRHLFFLQLIPPISTSFWSVGLEHTLLRLPDLRAASDSQPDRPHRRRESSSHRHPPALISSSTTTSAPVSRRRAPPSRLSATEARRHHARTPSESVRCGGDRWRMPAEPSGSRSRRRIRGCPAPSRHGEICPANGTHSPATCATQRGSVGRALRDGLQPCLRLETLLNRYTAVVSTVTVTLTQLVRSPVPGHVVSAGCARGLWVPVHRVLRPKRRLRLRHQRRWLLRRLQPVGPPPRADRPE